MTSKLQDIHNYLADRGADPNNFYQLDHQSVYLCMEIMEYAHRNQYRENGEEYANHPTRVNDLYRNFVGIIPNDYFCIDEDLLIKYGIPFKGAQEVALLHDVLEDSDLTMDDLIPIFNECGLKDYFDMYIKDPLINITHRKGIDDYPAYIEICMKHPTSALIKMMDMQDNLNMFDLVKFTPAAYKRSAGYLKYMYDINKKFNFIENIQKYKKEFNSKGE